MRLAPPSRPHGSMPHQIGNWLPVEEIGRGGQGVVYKVKPIEHEFHRRALIEEFVGAIRPMVHAAPAPAAAALTDAAYRSLTDLIDKSQSVTYAAAKTLLLDKGDGGKQARQRFAQEIAALRDMTGKPGILELLDSDVDAAWMVTRFCPGGTLAQNLSRFHNDALGALLALKPVVEAVAELHKNGYVHRDIKIANILIDEHGQLVLGDFGIVFTESGPRATEQLEGVGSHDWMPTWYQAGGRVDDIKPDFDVYALGKTLWSMVSGQPKLQLWYWDRAPNRLEEMRDADVYGMKRVNRILASTVVERQSSCMSSATELLKAIDDAIADLAGNGSRFRADVRRRCMVCRRGSMNRFEKANWGCWPFLTVSSGRR
jgi:serine/threonine protein kinase